jgi:hypothetical protein
MIRTFGLESYGKDCDHPLTELPEAWKELQGPPVMAIRMAILAGFGFAEEVIGLLEYEDGWFMVGIGESLRPFDKRYEGHDRVNAETAFWNALQKCAWDLEA